MACNTFRGRSAFGRDGRLQRWAILFSQLCLFLLPFTPVSAETLHHDNHVIHYTTFPSTIIPAEVAAAHDIVRAPNRMVINISGLELGEPVSLNLSGTVTNLLEQVADLTFKEVREQDAIYYLASHTSLEQDLLRFNIDVVIGDETINFDILRRFD